MGGQVREHGDEPDAGLPVHLGQRLEHAALPVAHRGRRAVTRVRERCVGGARGARAQKCTAGSIRDRSLTCAVVPIEPLGGALWCQMAERRFRGRDVDIFPPSDES